MLVTDVIFGKLSQLEYKRIGGFLLKLNVIVSSNNNYIIQPGRKIFRGEFFSFVLDTSKRVIMVVVRCPH